MTFEIDGREIGNSMQPYVIAELSANHNGSLARAKESIKAARDSGAPCNKAPNVYCGHDDD